MFHLGIFGTEFEKYYCHIGNEHPQVCLFSKFKKITKMPTFRQKAPDLSIFELKFEKHIVIFETSTLKFV